MNVTSAITTRIAASWTRRSEGRRHRQELAQTVLTEAKKVCRYYEHGPWQAWEPTGSAMIGAMTRADQAALKLLRLDPALEGAVRPLLATSDAMLQERMAGGRRVSTDLARDHRTASKAFTAASGAAR